MAAFSRLQLAAALLEYDNDPDNPRAPRRSAQDSAIFSHLRRANGYIRGATVEEATRTRDLLGVALPSESGAGLPTDIKSVTMKSRTSMDLLQNPFGEDESEAPDEEEELEVDLQSWGLDSFMPKEKASKSAKGKEKAKSEILPSSKEHAKQARISHGRSMSEFGMDGAFMDSRSVPEPGLRRNSISNPLDMEKENDFELPPRRRRLSSYGVIEGLPVKTPLLERQSFSHMDRDTIPFPSSSSPGPDSEFKMGFRAGSHFDSHARTRSTGTVVLEEDNLFAIPPPPEERASRFDPKYASNHGRTGSNATRLSVGAQQTLRDDDGRSVSGRSAMGGDIKSRRNRRASAASFGTRDMLNDDDELPYDEYPEQGMPEKRYSRLDLMRPKVLIMPSPLQNQVGEIPGPAPRPPREGFLDSSDARPLPPGARSSSRFSMIQSSNVPVPSNSYTPNPRLSLSASQLLFRNNLAVDGERDVTYNDIDGNMRRAQNDGEQITMDHPEDTIAEPVKELPPTVLEEYNGPFRPAGKLFGKSLIDDLESRKQQIKSKQRVFYGDQRPSMMDRGQVKRSSTLIDPASLNLRPEASRQNSANSQSALQRQGSRSGKPLLSFGDDGKLAETTVVEAATQPQLLQVGDRNSRLPKSQSVFGVDKLWEHEMVKLKEIEAQEKVEAEERRKRDEADEAKKAKKKGGRKKKGKKGDGPLADPQLLATSSLVAYPVSTEEVAPSPSSSAVSKPLLPNIDKVTTRRRTVPVPTEDDDSDDESSASEAASRPTQGRDEAAEKWLSDDEEGGPSTSKLVPGIRPGPQFGGAFVDPGDDSDEDVPLSVALQRASEGLLSPRPLYRGNDSEDEDRPLSMLLSRPKFGANSMNVDRNAPSLRSPVSSQSLAQPDTSGGVDDEEEDDVPLGIRASRLPPMAGSMFSAPLSGGISGLGGSRSNGEPGEEDDDRPLGMHPEQMRKSQYNMFAQMQQQQMLEAQMRNSMMFNPMMMMPSMPSLPTFGPQLPPPQDAQKFGRVDKWRRDVAVEGSTA